MTGAVLVAAAMTTGLVAGVFLLYAHTIMPGLGRTDDRTFVGAFQAIDRAIINPFFMACFFGALVLTGVAAALHLRAGHRGVLPWLVVAFGLYLVVVVITLAVNVPVNDAIKAAGEPDRITDLARVRRDFGEARWRAWNLVRVVLSSTAFGCLLVTLVLHGRRG
ncbi:anthrone oxygenase family protein [Plantactinospora endophytica]|uniref:anthrone oxygenase family protein n=1 Tax=Plantactinospora endophytica TaxID=673535 RepID=UPI001EF2EF7E|nr:anthrone oxygenase family protein [Plantactinospora endophytica]